MNLRIIVALIVVLFSAACSESPAKTEALDEEIVKTLSASKVSFDQTSADADPVDIKAGFAAAVLEALERNDGYRAALKFEAETAAAIGVALSGRRPQITANTTLGAIYEGDPISDQTAGIAGGITLSQLIYDGGATDGSIDRATAQAVASRSERLERENAIALEAARAWVDLWQYQNRIAWLDNKTNEMDAVVLQIQRMATNGMIDRAALDSAKRQIVDVALERATLVAQLDDAKSRFRRYFGASPASVSKPKPIMTGKTARLRAADWKTAPRLRRSSAELIAAKAAEAEAEAEFKPKVSLQTGFMSPMNSDDATDVTAGFRVEHTFGDGGRRQSLLNAAKARVDALDAKLADEQQDTSAQMRAAIDRLKSIERSMPLLKDKIRLSASEAKTARSQIATGQSNLRQLVEAEIENYRSRDSEIQMEAELRLLLLEIAARAGTLTQLIGATK